MGKSLKIGTLASRSLINFAFLLSHTGYFDESIILLFSVFTTFGFLLSVFLSTLQTIR